MSIFTNLVRAADGVFSAAYGPFVLQSALQPIFRQFPNGLLDIVAFEGLVRASRDGIPFSPAQFFPLIAAEDTLLLDSLLRTLHILNAGQMNRRHARVFVNFDPRLYNTSEAVRHEIERIRLAAHEANLTPDRIVCEVSEENHDNRHLIQVIRHLRENGVSIALDEYGTDDNDISRVKALRPDYLKFEGRWVRDFMRNSAGFALLKVIVRQFLDDGIQPVFEGLEELWQVDLCKELEVPLVQGYILARPEIAPTTFNERFPEMLLPPADPFAPPGTAPSAASNPDAMQRPDARTARRTPVFGRKSR